MAKAGVETSIEWIWQRDALAWVHEAFGSLELAKELLVKWLAAGDVPWSCVSWKGLDAAGVVKLEQDLREPGPLVFLTPTKAYHEGDSRFWAAGLAIDWEDNSAREQYVIGGAAALGIKVSREHVLARLPARRPSPPSGSTRGRRPAFDWDALHAECLRRIDDNGCPRNISEFTQDLLLWCQNQFGEDGTPDHETARKYVTKWIEGWDRSLPRS
jgi:hypothetical protein